MPILAVLFPSGSFATRFLSLQIQWLLASFSDWYDLSAVPGLSFKEQYIGQGRSRDSVLAACRRKPYLLKQMMPISIFDISRGQMVSIQIIEAFLQIVCHTGLLGQAHGKSQVSASVL